MDFRFSDEEEAFRQEVRAFIAAEWPKSKQTGDSFTKKLAARGWLTMSWPSAHAEAPTTDVQPEPRCEPERFAEAERHGASLFAAALDQRQDRSSLVVLLVVLRVKARDDFPQTLEVVSAVSSPTNRVPSVVGDEV